MKLIKFICIAGLLCYTVSCSVFNVDKGYRNATVSWYGEKFNGRQTASGETYNMHKLTAAHKTLPFGTRVEIMNPKNKKKIIVRITDRGPFVKGREFDLSKKAFSKIASLEDGVLNVKYKIIR